MSMSTHHVIIGGGPAATNAMSTLRQIEGSEARITLVCDEPAHSRMALPYWLSGNIPREHSFTADASYFDELNVTAHLNVRADSIDPQQQTVRLSNGTALTYDKLLLATGSSPLTPGIPGMDLPGVQPLWTIDHTQSAMDVTSNVPSPRVVLVGAGFIGFIVLGAMFKRGWRLRVVERENQVLPRMLDTQAAEIVQNWLSERDIPVHTGATVTSITAKDKERIVHLADGSQLAADLVIVATGVKANTQLAQRCGIATDKGILVDQCLQTNLPNIFAAGDVAQGPVLFSETAEVHAIHPTAVDHGRVAAANMAGQDVNYPGSLSMNVVDVCGLQCASYGIWSEPTADSVTIAHPEQFIYRRLFWRDDKLVGAIFTGRAPDVGMLTDLGMLKGLMQTQVAMGPWKQYLQENPFDVRRAFIALGVAGKLAKFTLLGRPSSPSGYRHHHAQPDRKANPLHQVFSVGRELYRNDAADEDQAQS
jgi:NAD(P)H-nitrite reductase large subunit